MFTSRDDMAIYTIKQINKLSPRFTNIRNQQTFINTKRPDVNYHFDLSRADFE